MNTKESEESACNCQSPINSKYNRFELGKEFNNEYLTPREIDVLKYLILGYTAKKIASNLGISVRTVETYLEVLKLKFQCKKKWEIIEKSIRLGLINLLKI